MAKWSEVKRYLQNHYMIDDQDQDWLRLIFTTRDERTQLVLIERGKLGNNKIYIQVTSPIGPIAPYYLDNALSIDVYEKLTNNDEYIGLGHIFSDGEKYWLRHSMLAKTISYTELDMVLRDIAHTADFLEERFVGGDDY